MELRHCPYCGEPIRPGDEVCSKTGKLLPYVTDTLAPGSVLHNRYEIQKLIHSGGMGYVYLALDKRLQRHCVVKQVKEPVRSDAHLQRLEAEALQMAKLSHPNLAMILDHFVEGRYYYLVVEYISGKTLSQILEERGGKLDEREVVRWAVGICYGVGYLHKKGLIHRDISPDNIMLTDENFIKLVDFGTMRELKQIAAGKAPKEGKFGFTPPEQWEGKPVPQSDIFSIAATMYYLLTGYLPLSSQYRENGEPQPSDYNPEYPPIRAKNPAVSVGLQEVLEKALQTEVEKRYATCEEFKNALVALSVTPAKREDVLAGSTPPSPRPSEVREPILLVDTPRLDFGSVKHGRRLKRKLVVRNAGYGVLRGKIIPSEPWIKVTPSEINLWGYRTEVVVCIETGHLPAETAASGDIHIETNGGNERVTVAVSTVGALVGGLTTRQTVGAILGTALLGIMIAWGTQAASRPVLTVDLTVITFSDLEAGRTTAGDREVVVTNSGKGTLQGTISTDCTWLEVNPQKIEVGGSESTKVIVWANTSGIKEGENREGHLIIKTNGGERTIPVYLTTKMSHLIFSDDFRDSSSGWCRDSSDRAKFDYSAGEYHALVREADSLWWCSNPRIAEVDDFALEVDARWSLLIPVSSENCYGVIFRKQDTNNFYLFSVYSGTQSYAIAKQVEGTWHDVKDWTYSPDIQAGWAVNHLKVVCQGSRISVYANGKLLTTVTDTSFSRGKIALSVGKGKNAKTDADAYFDNFKLYRSK